MRGGYTSIWVILVVIDYLSSSSLPSSPTHSLFPPLPLSSHLSSFLPFSSPLSFSLSPRSELENQKNINAKTSDQLSDMKLRLQESHQEAEDKGEQLRIVRAHNLKLNVTLEQLERGSEADNRDRLTLERR